MISCQERALRAGKKNPAFPSAVRVGKAGEPVLIHAPYAIARCEEGDVYPRWIRFPGSRVSYTLAFPWRSHSGLVSAHPRYSCGNSSLAAFPLSTEVFSRPNEYMRTIADVRLLSIAFRSGHSPPTRGLTSATAWRLSGVVHPRTSSSRVTQHKAIACTHCGRIVVTMLFPVYG